MSGDHHKAAGKAAGKAHGKTAARPAGRARPGGAGRPQGGDPARDAARAAAIAARAAELAAVPKLGWREAIASTVTGLGFELVDVERAQRGLLRVTIDRIPGRSYLVPSEFVLVDDCEQVTRQLQYALEVEGLDYARLEVSSPGLDRPLKTEADYERFSGQAVSITLKVPFERRKVWQGVLGRADGGDWQLVFRKDSKSAEQSLGFKFDEVREARLVPVVNFKGRQSQDGGTAGAAPDAAPGSDGG